MTPIILCPYCGEPAALLYGTITPSRPDNIHDAPHDYRWWWHCRRVIGDQTSTGEHWERVRMFVILEQDTESENPAEAGDDRQKP